MQIFIGLSCLLSSEKLGRYGAWRNMQGTASAVITGLKSLRPHGCVIQWKISSPCLPSRWNFHSHTSAAFRCSLGEQSSGHPSVLFPMRLWAEKLVFIVSDAVDSVCSPTLLHVFTADGAHGKWCLLCVHSQWLFYQILCSCPESGGKCITNVTAENLIRLSVLPTSL